MKNSETKGNYSEMLNSMEREFFNSELNKLVDRKNNLMQRPISVLMRKVPATIGKRRFSILRLARRANMAAGTASLTAHSKDSSHLALTLGLKHSKTTILRRKTQMIVSTRKTLESTLSSTKTIQSARCSPILTIHKHTIEGKRLRMSLASL